MKKIKYILLFLLMITGCGIALAQDPAPSNAVQLTTNTPYYQTTTGLHWYYNGTTYLWYKALGVKDSTYYVTPWYASQHFAPIGSGVTSFNTRTGAVTAQSGDYASYYLGLHATADNSFKWNNQTNFMSGLSPNDALRYNGTTWINSSILAMLPLNWDSSTWTMTISQATTSTNGYLSSIDWNNFNDKQAALGFTPENVANKATDFTTLNNTLYPSTQAISNYVSSNYVPLTRTLTINGTTQDLSTNRTWTVTANTSNALTLGYGFTGQPLSFNGSSAITAKIDTSVITTRAQVRIPVTAGGSNPVTVTYSSYASTYGDNPNVSFYELVSAGVYRKRTDVQPTFNKTGTTINTIQFDFGIVPDGYILITH